MVQCNFIIGSAHIDIGAKESKRGLYQDNILHICRTSGEVLLKTTANVILLCKAFFIHLILTPIICTLPLLYISVIQCLDTLLCSDCSVFNFAHAAPTSFMCFGSREEQHNSVKISLEAMKASVLDSIILFENVGTVTLFVFQPWAVVRQLLLQLQKGAGEHICRLIKEVLVLS